jgi:ABC-2 type transporter.
MADVKETGNVTTVDLKYRGRIRQIPIYVGKHFRMFIYQNDWKVIPMAAFIAMLVSIVIKDSFAVTMEGTGKGALAITSIALWNGCFNSIQVVCRERNIVKREHRSGMHISSYIIAHMIYQAFICIIQTITTAGVFIVAQLSFPQHGIIMNSFFIELMVTIFLITYASDMLSLFVSAVAKTTTAAMTVMPLILMVQLIFSGNMFSLPKSMNGISSLMISNHGTAAICAEVDFNNLPSSAGWNMLKKVGNNSDDPNVSLMIEQMEVMGYDKVINEEVRKSNFKEAYVGTPENIEHRWKMQIIFIFFFAALSVIALEFIDKDKR